jgi:hypothetical protein
MAATVGMAWGYHGERVHFGRRLLHVDQRGSVDGRRFQRRITGLLSRRRWDL